MTEWGYNLFTPHRLLQMWAIPASDAANLPSTCDEELADEADEPPDDSSHDVTDFVPHSYHGPSYYGPCLSDGEFVKHAIRHPVQTESLLTRALMSPEIIPADRRITGGGLQRGFCTLSTWSNVSTADLTSDGGLTSPSRSSTPSPPPPMFMLMDPSHTKPSVMHRETVEPVKDQAAEELGRKRCITFACGDKPANRRAPEQQARMASPPKMQLPAAVVEQPKRPCALKFVCTQREEARKLSPPRRRSPLPAPKRAEAVAAESDVSVTAESAAIEHAGSASSAEGTERPVAVPEPKPLYDSESVGNSWTNEPIDRSRILKVDGLLQKELDIRKLSQEAEDEAKAEEEDEDEDEDEVDDDVADEDEDEEDQDEEDEDEDDEDDEDDDYDGESGNETDNEEGFASDDDTDDEFFGGNKPPAQYHDIGRPLFRHHGSNDSIESLVQKATPRPIRPHTPELPDSTDFVCGTLDEDRPLEDAYLSCMESRRRSKHIPTPQDIDPSFPTSDNEDDDADVQPSLPSERERRGRTSPTKQAKNTSRSPRSRAHSPAPLRRVATVSPPPRRNGGVSRHASPAPRRSRHNSPAPLRRSRHNSPAPARRARSPAPIRKNKHAGQFNHGNNVVRTKSLPRPGHGFGARKTSQQTTSATESEQHTRPMFIKRGAMDIRKGLEEKRERRKARLARKQGGKEATSPRKAGEGVEKMREVALEICGKGKRPQAQWVLSA